MEKQKNNNNQYFNIVSTYDYVVSNLWVGWSCFLVISEELDAERKVWTQWKHVYSKTLSVCLSFSFFFSSLFRRKEIPFIKKMLLYPETVWVVLFYSYMHNRLKSTSIVYTKIWREIFFEASFVSITEMITINLQWK